MPEYSCRVTLRTANWEVSFENVARIDFTWFSYCQNTTAHGSGWPRFARGNIGSALGRGLCGKGVLRGHGGSGPDRGVSRGEVAGGGAGLHRTWVQGTRQAGDVRDGGRQVVCSGLMGNIGYSLAVGW